jgi:hypothetical protein
VFKVHKVLLEHKVHKVHRVPLLMCLVHKDLKDPKALLEYKVHKALKET